MRYLVPIVIATVVLLVLDYYVYRNWRRFARGRAFEWTLPLYRVLLALMPLSLPLYFSLYRWWEVEPRLARALFFGFWVLYYVPKVPIVAVLLGRDAVRLTRRVFRGDAGESSTPRSESSDPLEVSPGRRNEVTLPRQEAAITRKEFLRRMGWSAAAVPFVLTGYGVFGTLYDFVVRRVEVPVRGLPRAFERLTIAQISDLHAGSLLGIDPMHEAVSIVNGLRPDVVVVTGDFVNHDVDEIPRILPALGELDAPLGVYGCLGNHDHYANTEQLVGRLRTTPMDLLINEHRTLAIDGGKLHIIGTDNTGFSQRYADLPRAVAGIDPEEENAQILLAHDPTFWDSHVRPDFSGIDVMLCGHTHGGQFGIEYGPFRWSLAQVRYERWAGLYAEPRKEERGPQFLYVNRGIGTVGPPLRLGIRPEITLLTLRRG